LVNEKVQVDYENVHEMLLKKVEMEHEDIITNLSSNILPEVTECTKILRRALVSLTSSNNLTNNKYNALIIDCIWKITLLSMDSLFEHESRFISKASRELAQNNAALEERFKKRLERLESREQELQLEYTIKQEQYEAQIRSLTQEKEQLDRVIEARMMEIQDLVDPSRFLQMHYFLMEFQYKFDYSYDRVLTRLHLTNNILHILITEQNTSKELNDELSKQNAYFPKYLIEILRNFQKQLEVTDDEMRYRIRSNKEIIKNMRNGILVVKKVGDNYSQTDLSNQSKMELYNDKLKWKAIVLNEHISKAKAMSPIESFKYLEKVMKDKLLHDNFSTLFKLRNSKQLHI